MFKFKRVFRISHFAASRSWTSSCSSFFFPPPHPSSSAQTSNCLRLCRPPHEAAAFVLLSEQDNHRGTSYTFTALGRSLRYPPPPIPLQHNFFSVQLTDTLVEWKSICSRVWNTWNQQADSSSDRSVFLISWWTILKSWRRIRRVSHNCSSVSLREAPVRNHMFQVRLKREAEKNKFTNKIPQSSICCTFSAPPPHPTP